MIYYYQQSSRIPSWSSHVPNNDPWDVNIFSNHGNQHPKPHSTLVGQTNLDLRACPKVKLKLNQPRPISNLQNSEPEVQSHSLYRLSVPSTVWH